MDRRLRPRRVRPSPLLVPQCGQSVHRETFAQLKTAGHRPPNRNPGEMKETKIRVAVWIPWDILDKLDQLRSWNGVGKQGCVTNLFIGWGVFR